MNRATGVVSLSFVLLLSFSAWLVNTRWLARHVSNLRERAASSCSRAVPIASAPGRPPLRLLVCLASGHFRASRFELTARVVSEYLAFDPSRYAVTVSVDTIDATVVAALKQRFPGAGSALQLTLWDAEQLAGAFPASAGWGGEPLEFLVSHAHRLYMHQRTTQFDLFVYTEDDMLLRQGGVDMFLEHQQALWAKGWLPGFIREEAAFGSGEPTCSDINLELLKGPELPRVFITEGLPNATALARYASFANGPYSAVWMLTREQLEVFVSDPSKVYAAGYSEFDTRARMSWGFMYARTRDNRLLPRVLVPLVGASTDPRTHVLHLPSNYCGRNNSGWEACVAFVDLQRVLQGVKEEQLVVHSAPPCGT